MTAEQEIIDMLDAVAAESLEESTLRLLKDLEADLKARIAADEALEFNEEPETGESTADLVTEMLQTMRLNAVLNAAEG